MASIFRDSFNFYLRELHHSLDQWSVIHRRNILQVKAIPSQLFIHSKIIIFSLVYIGHLREGGISFGVTTIIIIKSEKSQGETPLGLIFVGLVV